MTGRDVFKIWAPTGAKWTEWVRPVPFIAINEYSRNNYIFDFSIPNINYIKKMPNDTAVIVDLPGNDSIKEGIGLAKIGFRLVPIYNGTNEQKGAIPTVNNHAIETGLIKGALELEKIEVKSDALPVFLLDSNRTNRFKMNVSIFDNSWDIYPQDMPSAEYLLKNGINKIIVRGECLQIDLKKILYDFQKKGIQIFLTNGYEEPKIVKINKPVGKQY